MLMSLAQASASYYISVTSLEQMVHGEHRLGYRLKNYGGKKKAAIQIESEELDEFALEVHRYGGRAKWEKSSLRKKLLRGRRERKETVWLFTDEVKRVYALNSGQPSAIGRGDIDGISVNCRRLGGGGRGGLWLFDESSLNKIADDIPRSSAYQKLWRASDRYRELFARSEGEPDPPPAQRSLPLAIGLPIQVNGYKRCAFCGNLQHPEQMDDASPWECGEYVFESKGEAQKYYNENRFPAEVQEEIERRVQERLAELRESRVPC